MGWKAVKDYLKIEDPHLLVHMAGGNLYIGSGYISDLMIFSPSGKVIKDKEHFSSEQLRRIRCKLTEAPQTLADLLACEDSFTASIPVHTYIDGKIVEKYCEKVGHPNNTHDGQIMFENTHFVLKKDAIARARKSVESGIANFQASLTELERRVAECKEGLERQLMERSVLDRLYPQQEEST